MIGLRSARWRAGLLPAVLLAFGCGDDEPNAVARPDAIDALPADTAVISTDSIPGGLTADALAEWRAARDALVGAGSLLGIGEYEEGPAVFGEITDAAIDGAGNILVLDRQAVRVSVFDPEGGFLGSFGGRGDGPEELREPRHFTLLGEDRVAVPIPGRIKVFRPEDGQWRLGDLVELSLLANDICSTRDDRLFVSAWQEEENTVVHEISGAEIAASLGTGYPSENWLLRFQLSEGLLACMDHPPGLAYALRYAPHVRLFALDGSLLWNAVLSDYTPIEISTTPGSVSMSLTDDYDLLASIHGTPSGHIILQYAHRRAGNDSHFRTYLVDAATGSGALVSRDLPSIKFIGPDSYIAAFADPYPRIEVREVDGWEG